MAIFGLFWGAYMLSSRSGILFQRAGGVDARGQLPWFLGEIQSAEWSVQGTQPLSGTLELQGQCEVGSGDGGRETQH